MRQDKFSKAHLILYACGIIPVVWLALLLAPYLSSGLVDLVRNGGVALEHPFHIIWCEDSLKTVLIFMLCYGLGIGVYLSTDRNYRRRENTAPPSGVIPKQSTGNIPIRSRARTKFLHRMSPLDWMAANTDAI